MSNTKFIDCVVYEPCGTTYGQTADHFILNDCLYVLEFKSQNGKEYAVEIHTNHNLHLSPNPFDTIIYAVNSDVNEIYHEESPFYLSPEPNVAEVYMLNVAYKFLLSIDKQ